MCKEANYDDSCVGIITWCHTFSPSKMWINGLVDLQKPWCHFATQYNQAIPNEEINMDFMNLNQAAHGDREHGFIGARLRKPRKVIAGYWRDEPVQKRIGDWMKAAVGVAVSKSMKVMRFGDNMREVAVTEGDKVEVQTKLGWQVNTWAVGDLVKVMNEVTEEEIDALMAQYQAQYDIATDKIDHIRYQAREEIAMKKMLEAEGCKAFSNTFQDLYGMEQLPGLASQHLMAQGKSWEYRSSICAGGPPVERNWDALGPVWEPFLYLNADGDLTVVYTDERPHTDRRFNQTLAVAVSKDGGKTWGEQKMVCAIPDGEQRPGMAVVTRLPNGRYFMCYEIVCFAACTLQGETPTCDVYCRFSDDGVDWGDPEYWGVRIETADGIYLGNMPYCLWVPQGGENGTIIVSGKRDSGPVGLRDPGDFLVNYHLGEGPWERVPMLVSYDARIHQAGWSMGMCTIENGTRLLQLAPTQCDPVLLQISYGIGNLETAE